MYHLGEGTRPCPFPVTENELKRVTEPEDEQLSDRYLGMSARHYRPKNLNFARTKEKQILDYKTGIGTLGDRGVGIWECVPRNH